MLPEAALERTFRIMGHEVSRWIPVCREAELEARKARVVEAGGDRIAVFRSEDGPIYAVEDRCPHRGSPLSAGVVYEGNLVACLDHGWTICLADGMVQAPDTGRVRTFPTMVADGMILVGV